ncbi:MAG: single-stranded-DNA-specific exonuclease RecJ [Eubacterium sp.]|nr:single-stranded-DNA-specific exonuclease RecJ [Eubacterium sp.]
MKKRWILQTKPGDFRGMAERYGISPVTARCMVNRGICREDEMDTYLKGGLEKLHSPWLLADMDKAVQIILEHKAGCGAIASDFDCDGIFSAFILNKGFETCGIKSRIFTPDRIEEGYGLNRRIVDEAAAEKASFLITCDNGIAALDEVRYARERGLPVIVTDHHEIQKELPEADAVVDPKREDCSYPFKGLCGAGVAFQLISALYEKMGISAEKREELLEYAAIATVADVMELQGENRVLVKAGLRRLRETKNVGLRALLQVQGLSGRDIKAYHIGFVLGPCFNAAGRINTVEKAFALLKETDSRKALELAEELKEINETRKQMTEEAAEAAFELLEQGGKTDQPVYILHLPECHESLVGIVAGRIKEAYHHPVIVFTSVGEGLVKGSGRSIESYHMFEGLMACSDLMVRFGGHRMAAGMTMRQENLPELERRLNEKAGLQPEDFIPVLNIDVPLPVGHVSEKLITDLEALEPFGCGNPKPVFAEQHFRILRAARRGKRANVLTMKVANETGTTIDAICFDDIDGFEKLICQEWGDEELEKLYAGKENAVDIGLAYYPSVNEYGGFRTLQIVVTDFCRIRQKTDKAESIGRAEKEKRAGR